MEDSIFRKDAIEAAGERQAFPVGTALLSGKLIISLVASFIAAALFLSLIADFSRKETVAGRVIADSGSSQITSSRGSIVEKVFVKEGDHVKKGQVLVELSVDSRLTSGARVADKLNELEAARRSSRIEELRKDYEILESTYKQAVERSRSLREKIAYISDEIESLNARSKLSEETLSDVEGILESGVISRIELRRYQDQAAQHKLSVITAEKERSQVRADYSESKTQIDSAKFRMDGARFRLEAETAALGQEDAKLNSQYQESLVSPHDGVVSIFNVRQGVYIEPNKVIAVVAGESSVSTAELWLPSTSVGFVVPGQSVRVMVDAFPYDRFGIVSGTVSSVSSAPLAQSDMPEDVRTNDRITPMYRALIELPEGHINAYGSVRPLVPGMSVKADIILERRRAIDVLMDPIRAARKKAQS